MPVEIGTCRRFLRATIETMPGLRAIVGLGRIAHESVVRTFDMKLSAATFGHGKRHDLVARWAGSPARDGAAPIMLYDSYHCSRYNTNTGVLTAAMFEAVFASVRADLDALTANRSA